MKPYLTLDECRSIIDLINSSDEESYFLGLNILVSKSFKTTSSLRTAIYNAQNLLRKLKKKNIQFYSMYLKRYESEIKDALHRYINKLYGPCR